MAPSTNKKVIVTRFDREAVAGFAQTPGGFTADSVEVLTPSGSLLKIPYSEVKVVCFVREFEGGDSWREHRHFATRPKTTAPVPAASAGSALVAAAANAPAAGPTGNSARPGAAAQGREPQAASASQPGPAAPAPAVVTPAPAAAPKETPRAPEKPASPPAKPAEAPLRQWAGLVDSDPRQAVSGLKPLAQADPRNVELQATYLAALYRSNNAWDFERVLTRVNGSGINVKALLAVPAFRKAMADESRLQKARQGLLPEEVMATVLAGL